MVGKVITGSHYGLKDWLVQRISAVIMVAYAIFLTGFILANLPLRYDHWRVLFSTPGMQYFSLLFFLSLYWHAWIGMRNILMDYVHHSFLRLGLQTAVIVTLIVYMMWTIRILWSL